ncbi:MAG: S-methyl-5-thioribose-1-phosphate isomerase [Planctomycetes bacterium]|nr:S-methyl-5-thioribose-1-phosphate isomerase [Planctomycetota bacterium]MCL4730108.1 S-methyl-5-thioribose-1-phosphate isomerase [Planctomycetota bacterium]
MPKTVQWLGDAASGFIRIIDQTLLPAREQYLDLADTGALVDAIARLAVRGAPAIGVAGAYGCVLALRQGMGEAGLERVAGARPTAVNLRWAVQRVRKAANGDPARALDEARRIHAEDEASCAAIGRHGAALIRDGMGIITHCNAGALATAGMGTALAPLYTAHQQGRRFTVFADETRPLLQGARLTAFELGQAGIAVTVIADNMAPVVLRRGLVQLAVTGADRIAANGDAANKIGTYGLALACKAHNVPLYIAAPRSTFDAATPDGAAIPIEERSGDELRRLGPVQTAPPDVAVFNPAFDVTPAALIAGYITENGILQAGQIAGWLAAPQP